MFSIAADDVTIAELTIQRAYYHPIHVTGGADSNTENTLIYRVRVVDPGQQAIKINAQDGSYADFGTIACSHIELTAEGRPHVTDCYTGGVDAHLAQGWTIRDNTITGFWCESGLSEHGVHVWNSGRDTVVERNTIVDCARGVGFGLGESGNGTARDYGDDPCPGVDGFVGHYGGVIRNNAIIGRDPAMFASQFGMDSGVALEQACGAVVTHNTVVALQPVPPRRDSVASRRIAAGAVTLGLGLAVVVAGAVLLAIDGDPIRRDCQADPDGDCRFVHATATLGIVGVSLGGAASVAGAVALGAGLHRRRRHAARTVAALGPGGLHLRF